jgi:uncharacterized protein (TIGR00369 family)
MGGSVQGGVTSTLLDAATGCAVQSRLEAGVGYVTLNLALNYVRPITVETGPIRCTARVKSMGRTVAVSEGEILASTGKLLASATATCLFVTTATS